ncbi:hypothetical protein V6N13_097764 [Hibiscus sabdariffa]
MENGGGRMGCVEHAYLAECSAVKDHGQVWAGFRAARYVDNGRGSESATVSSKDSRRSSGRWWRIVGAVACCHHCVNASRTRATAHGRNGDGKLAYGFGVKGVSNEGRWGVSVSRGKIEKLGLEGKRKKVRLE